MDKKLKIKRIVGILLVALGLGAISFWELWGRENITYDSVAVLRSSVSKGTTISESMIRERKVNKAADGAILYQDKASICGLVSTQFIPQGAELYNEFFEESIFVVGNDTGKRIMTIPEDWVLSYPQTIKRGDEAYFYGDGQLISKAIVCHVRDAGNQEVLYDDERLQSSECVDLIEIIVTDRDVESILEYVTREEFKRMVILYE